MNSTKPTPEEAQAALRAVDQRTGQAVSAAVRNRSRAMDFVLGVALLAQGVCIDFFPPYSGWAAGLVAVVFVAYGALSYSRRGSSALGERVRAHRPAYARKYSVIFTSIIAVSLGAALIAQLVHVAGHVSWHVPYLATGIGVAFAIAAIGFGPQLRAGMARLASGTSR